MSFMLTTQQMHAQEKDVTRRLGWSFLKAGDMVMACVKCQGLRKGGKIQRIHPIEIVSNEPEILMEIISNPYRNGCYRRETHREGFPDLTEDGFIRMFMREMKCPMDQTVNRIEFKHRKGEG